jgi:hypothetical protein
MKGYKAINQFNLQDCDAFLRDNPNSPYCNLVSEHYSKLQKDFIEQQQIAQEEAIKREQQQRIAQEKAIEQERQQLIEQKKIDKQEKRDRFWDIVNYFIEIIVKIFKSIFNLFLILAIILFVIYILVEVVF